MLHFLFYSVLLYTRILIATNIPQYKDTYMNIYDIPHTAQVRIQQAYMVKQAAQLPQTVTITPEKPTLSHFLPPRLYNDNKWVSQFLRQNSVEALEKLQPGKTYKIPKWPPAGTRAPAPAAAPTPAAAPAPNTPAAAKAWQPYHDQPYFTVVTGSIPLAKLHGKWTDAMTRQVQLLNPTQKLNRLRPGSLIRLPATQQYQVLYKYKDTGIDSWRYTGNLADDSDVLFDILINAQSGGRDIRTEGNSTALGRAMITQLKVMDYMNRYPQLRAKYGKFVDSRLAPVFAGIAQYNRLRNTKGYKGPLDPRFAPGGQLPLSKEDWAQVLRLSRDMFGIDVQRAMRNAKATDKVPASHDALLRLIKGWRGYDQASAPKYYRHIFKLYQEHMQNMGQRQ